MGLLLCPDATIMVEGTKLLGKAEEKASQGASRLFIMDIL